MLEFDCSLKHGHFSLEVAFSAPSPGVTALFGRSGAGKSTVVSLLSGLLAAARGRIVLEGRCLDSPLAACPGASGGASSDTLCT
jgi:molybdate transport system ATP-binding protein